MIVDGCAGATDEMKQFEGKVVLVTGGNCNTGLEIVDSFLRDGAKVFFCGSSEASVAVGVEYAAAASCLKHSIELDVNLSTVDEIRRPCLNADVSRARKKS